jgi:hypothetical protein
MRVAPSKTVMLLATMVILASNQAMAAQIGTVRNVNGQYRWFLDLNGNKTWDGPSVDSDTQFGAAGDKPMAGDACNPSSDPSPYTEIFAVRGSTWWWSFNDQAWTIGDSSFDFGNNPQPVLFNDHIAAFNDGIWRYDRFDDHVLDSGDPTFSFGQAGDIPIIGVWNTAAGQTPGVFRIVDGVGKFLLDTDGTFTWTSGDSVHQFGQPGDIPVAANFNSSTPEWEFGVYRSNANGSGEWIIDFNGDRAWSAGDAVWQFGAAGDIPVVTHDKWTNNVCIQ